MNTLLFILEIYAWAAFITFCLEVMLTVRRSDFVLLHSIIISIGWPYFWFLLIKDLIKGGPDDY